MVASSELRSSDEATARPISSSAFNSRIDCSRSRVRSSTFCSRRPIGFLQLPGHAVEVVGEFLDLVGGLDLDAMAEIAGLELPGPRLQCADRHHHLARQQEPGEHREQDARRHQPSGAVEKIVDRLERRARQLLGEDVPVQPVDAGRSGEDRAARPGRGRRTPRSPPRRIRAPPAGDASTRCRADRPDWSARAAGRSARRHRRRRPFRTAPGRRNSTGT